MQKKLCPIAYAKSAWDFFWQLFFGKGTFLALVGGPKDFFGVLILPLLNHPCHLKSGVHPRASHCDDTSLWFQSSYLTCFKLFVRKIIDTNGYSVL